MSNKMALPSWQQTLWSQLEQLRHLDRLPHAILLTGQAGLGKRQLVDLWVAQLMCQHGSACGRCDACHWLSLNNHPDVHQLIPENNTHKVDTIRALIKALNTTAHQGGRKLVLIEQADCMNAASANALLKTLEEPSQDTLLILIAERPQQMLATIRSRCHQMHLQSPSSAVTHAYLAQQGIQLPQWPYWSQLLGGPLRLCQASQSGLIEQITHWRQLWQQSKKNNLLAPDIINCSQEQGTMLLNILYYELLEQGKQDPHWMAQNYKLMQLLQQRIQLLSTQTGLNPAPLLAELFSMLPKTVY